jgi:hypothetical protein
MSEKPNDLPGEFSGQVFDQDDVNDVSRPLLLGKQARAVEVHDLVPCGDEIIHELLLRVAARIDFRNGTKLGVRAEDEVD